MLTAFLLAVVVTLIGVAAWSWCAAAGRADDGAHLWMEDR